MTTHIIQRGSTLYLVEMETEEFVRITPLNGGEVFTRGLEDYLRTVNRFENNSKAQWKK